MTTPKIRRCWADESEEFGSPELEPLPYVKSGVTGRDALDKIPPNFNALVSPGSHGGLDGADNQIARPLNSETYGIDVYGDNCSIAHLSKEVSKFFGNHGVEVVRNVRRKKLREKDGGGSSSIYIHLELMNEESYRKAIQLNHAQLPKTLDPNKGRVLVREAEKTNIVDVSDDAVEADAPENNTDEQDFPFLDLPSAL